MSLVSGKKYIKKRAKCQDCGRITKVELYYNYETKEYKYFCEKCVDFLDSSWEQASVWDSLDPQGEDSGDESHE